MQFPVYPIVCYIRRSGNQDADWATAWDRQGHEFLGVFAKYRKANIKLRRVCLSVRPSVRMGQIGSHWKDFHEI